jgi:hypothetical protein
MTWARVLPLLAVIALAAGCSSSDSTPEDSSSSIPAPRVMRGLHVPARVMGEKLALATRSGFEPQFWPGVNLGSTVPGTLPGEVAARRADYDRWLPEIAALGARVIRVYTILAPDFYDALRAYDLAHPEQPLYVLHGVWIPEEQFLATGNLYAPSVTRGFREEIARAVAVVHGDATLPERPGHASGRYRSSIAPWVLGWSIGVEWDPVATASSDRLNADAPAARGRYVRSLPRATPTERWLAGTLDYLAGLEAKRGWSRPVTFTNWITTDPLRHPTEPLEKEDLVSIDAMHLRATPAWPGGLFASYHAYPYYPDFLRYEPRLQRTRDAHGRPDPYAGYLAALRRHHRGQALMITEFGVPSSLGLAHLGPLGRDQGDHSEQEAARIDADLLRTIRRTGLAGGILFEWADEWFKFTWNTIDYELPGERRALWRNDLTNEEHFGVLATEPDRAGVTLDGDDREWATNGSQVVAESRGAVREVRVAHDEEYLYLRLRLDHAGSWRRNPVQIGFDVQPGGNRGLPGLPGVDRRADVAVSIGPGDRAQIRQAASLDPVAFQYGLQRGFVDVDRSALEPGSGVWVPPRLILNRPYVVPVTGERRPVEIRSFGELPWGNGDPARAGFDQRHLVDGADHVVELRLPWAFLTFTDPSSHRVWALGDGGVVRSRHVGRVGITVVTEGSTIVTSGYDWEGWNRVSWHERRKAGWQVLKAAFGGR